MYSRVLHAEMVGGETWEMFSENRSPEYVQLIKYVYSKRSCMVDLYEVPMIGMRFSC
jgi:hypothetical protein